MSENYAPLSYAYLDVGVSYQRPAQRLPEKVELSSPALDVMTDFTQIAAMTMGPCGTLNAAQQRMIASGVRLLFIIDQHNHLLGIVTHNDLQGERPMRYLKEVGGKRDDIFVRDIMTPQDKLEVLKMADVRRAQVGDIVETLKAAGRLHALVVDYLEDGHQIVRGLFSSTQISKQLGTPVHIPRTEVAKTFAEVGAALAG